MDKCHGEYRYWTKFFNDRRDGCAGLRLHRELVSGPRRNVDPQCAGEVVYWDASGGFSFRTFQDLDVAVEIVGEVIDEARERIKVR